MKSVLETKTISTYGTNTEAIQLIRPLSYVKSYDSDLGEDGLKAGKVIDPDSKRVSIINVGHTRDKVYVFFGEGEEAMFFLSFEYFKSNQQRLEVFNQFADLMRNQEQIHIYAEDAYGHATWASRASKVPSIVFKTPTGEEIKQFTHYTWFDGHHLKGTSYPASCYDGYKDAQALIQCIKPISTTVLPTNLFSASTNRATASTVNENKPMSQPSKASDGLFSDKITSQNKDLNKNLRNAANRHELEKVKQCITAGADVNDPSPSNGKTPLHYACERFLEEEAARNEATKAIYAEIILELINHKADTTLKDHGGHSPNSYAMESTFLQAFFGNSFKNEEKCAP